MTRHVERRFIEPGSQPRDTWFIGRFDLDTHTGEASKPESRLNESMTGDPSSPLPEFGMIRRDLNHPLNSRRDEAWGGHVVTIALNDNANTFSTLASGDG